MPVHWLNSSDRDWRLSPDARWSNKSDANSDKAVEADIDIVVLYNSLLVDREKCPSAVKYRGKHVPMIADYSSNGETIWDYQAVKKALGE